MVLNAYEDQWRPRHIFGDHLDRLGEHAVVAQKMKPDAIMSDEDKRNLNQQTNRKIEASDNFVLGSSRLVLDSKILAAFVKHELQADIKKRQRTAR